MTHALSLALRLPALFNFDSLLSIPSVQALKGTGSSKVYDLVEGVFTKGGLNEWNAWVQKEGESSLAELGQSIPPGTPFSTDGCSNRSQVGTG